MMLYISLCNSEPYYKWLRHSVREKENSRLAELIETIHTESPENQ